MNSLRTKFLNKIIKSYLKVNVSIEHLSIVLHTAVKSRDIKNTNGLSKNFSVVTALNVVRTIYIMNVTKKNFLVNSHCLLNCPRI